MKKIFLVILSCAALYCCGPSKSEIQELAATENFPKDNFLQTVPAKRALVVVAHDDDLVAMSGTISKLHNSGWVVKELCFQSDDAARDSALVSAAKGIMQQVEFIKIPPSQRRQGNDTISMPWMPIPKTQIEKEFNKAAIAAELQKRINAFNPSVIFTLDNEIGGYGHPEHVLVSQLVLDLYTADSIKPQRIYQSVYPNSMEDKILKQRLTKLLEEWGYPNAYMTVLDMYKVQGMPEPTTEINIQDQSEAKMKFLRGFAEQERKTIGHFIPYFEDFDHDEYFGVFNREFFRVIEK